jgi:Kef-type K+ transport system membrane component KefB
MTVGGVHLVLADAVAPTLKPDVVLGFVLADLAIILIAARLVGGLARRLKQPTVVGEIIAGVLLGPTLLGATVFTWKHPWAFLHCDTALAATKGVPSITSCAFPPQARSTISVIGQVALILYMFLIGLELDFTMLKGKAKGVVTVAVGVIAVPLGLGLIIGPALYSSKFVANFGTAAQPSQTAFSLMVGSMLAVTAFPVMAHILQEKGLSRGQMGSIAIAATAALSVLMFLAVAASSSVAQHESGSKIALKFAIAAVYLAVMFFVVRPLLAPLGRAAEAKGEVTPNMFGIIFMVVFASAFAADRIGINVIPGAFLAGAVLPARELLFREMRLRLRDITLVVLLPVFLAFSGLNTDFTTLGWGFVAGIALFLVAGVVGKWLGGALFARLGGLSWREGNVLGILMNCRGLLVLVVALIALNANVITPQLQTGAVLMALITTAMTGPLFDAFLPSAAGTGDAQDHTIAEELPVLVVD